MPIDPLIGQTIRGTYFVQERIGGGGMGQVYKATQLNLDRPVALKLLRPSFHSDPTIVQRFQREARAASKLHHPNVIAVLDFGQTVDGTLFMAMEYVPGRDLLTVLRGEFPLGERRVVHLAAQVLSGLSEAHAAGIVHRDLKPANVMVETRRDEPDFVKVVDFGIAQIQEPGDGDGQLTQAGLICGTPDYMSPEQASLLPIDARSDLYSVGILLYQMLTGRHPFDAATPPAMVQAHAVQPPPPMAERCPPGHGVSPALEALVLRALAKSAADRFPSAEAMRRELIECPLDPALAASARPSTAAPGARATPSAARAQPLAQAGPPSQPTSLFCQPVPEPEPPTAPAAHPEEDPAAPEPDPGPPAPTSPAGRRRRKTPWLAALAAGASLAGALLFVKARHAREISAVAQASAAVAPALAAPAQLAPGPATSTQAGATSSEPPQAPAAAAQGARDSANAPAAPGPPAAARAASREAVRRSPPAPARAAKPARTAPRATAAAPRGQERKRAVASQAPVAVATAKDAPRPHPPRGASGEPAQAATAAAGEGARREAFVTREVFAYQQSYGDPGLQGRGRALLGRARWLLEPNGTLVFAPADEAPGFFPLTARATREGSRVRFEGRRTAAASGGPGYVRISGEMALAGEPVLTVDLEFGRALGKEGAELETTYHARARLRLAPE